MWWCLSSCDAPTDEETIVSVEDEEVPNEFLCCITKAVMKDPVLLITSSSYSYERWAIERWLQRHPRRDPMTGREHAEPLKYLANRSLKATIDRWRRHMREKAVNQQTPSHKPADRKDQLRTILETPRPKTKTKRKKSSSQDLVVSVPPPPLAGCACYLPTGGSSCVTCHFSC
ncbi:hypothetical protein CTAYLR_004860 [Chrysophaeum taylorii]|uniref:U-box domain-containing protein n=1 Tax=Chrysophaeum taylorii TaxID=2483200 RepID=A0AAD7UGB2_9STRA|nr:hypothetical protein CTAYLR_004860 [Chrysophaeum taylorii]